MTELEKWGVGSKKDAKPFDSVSVNGRPYDLIFGEHPHSRNDNNVYARSSSGDIEAFDGHRLCWRVEVEERNYLKQSELSGDEVRKGGSYRLFVDGECIYEGFCRSVEYGMKAAGRMMEALGDVCGGDWLRAKDRERLVGRPIYYHGVPAVISSLIVDQGCVIIHPADGHKLKAPPHVDDPEDWLLDHEDGVKDEVTSPHIWWWRR